MSELRTNTILIRDRSYTVKEMTGKQMTTVRKLVANETEKYRLESWIAFQCCVDPKFKTEDEAAEQPQIVIDRISAEAFRLTQDKGEQGGEDDAKKA